MPTECCVAQFINETNSRHLTYKTIGQMNIKSIIAFDIKH